jgi:hypothetical protein
MVFLLAISAILNDRPTEKQLARENCQTLHVAGTAV